MYQQTKTWHFLPKAFLLALSLRKTKRGISSGLRSCAVWYIHLRLLPSLKSLPYDSLSSSSLFVDYLCGFFDDNNRSPQGLDQALVHSHASGGHAHDVTLLQHGELPLGLVVVVPLLELEEAGKCFRRCGTRRRAGKGGRGCTQYSCLP